MRILIAEDDAVSRKILEVSLARWGHEVELTSDVDLAHPSSPEEALDLVAPEARGRSHAYSLPARVRGTQLVGLAPSSIHFLIVAACAVVR